MRPDVVVDIGNTRVKWGAVGPAGVARTASLDDDPGAWQTQLDEWTRGGTLPARPLAWTLATVQPARRDRLWAWLTARGDTVSLLTLSADLPLKVALPEPDKAGIDRLLNAVAAIRRLEPGHAAVLIDAGSAVTVDFLDEEHVFRGGLIAPGLELMAKALHDYTALLPLVEVTSPIPPLPAVRTTTAMQAGIFLAVSGCIRQAVHSYATQAKRPPRLFFTGGRSYSLLRGMGLVESSIFAIESPLWCDWQHWPEQTLSGILYAAEAKP